MKLLIENNGSLKGLATLCEGYYDIINGLNEMENDFIKKFGHSMFPLVIVLLKETRNGIVESDDEFFDAWSICDKTDVYDWECEELYEQLWKESLE